MLLWECCEIFKNTCFEEHLQTAASVLLIMKLVISISLLNDVWFLLRRFVDLVKIYSLLIISRNYSSTFLLLDLQKNRSKVKYCSKGHLLWYQDFDRFRQVAVYFNDWQINRWQNLRVPFYRTTPDDCFWNLYSIFSLNLFLFLWINLFCCIADV